MNDHPISLSMASVLVVESDTNVNNSIQTVIKDLGFQEINSATSLEKVITDLQSKKIKPDWIITATELDHKLNGLNLLGIILQSLNLQHIKVSFVVNPEEDFCLPYAFQLGLFSCHNKTETRANLTNEFKNLIRKFASDSKSASATSAGFLRDVLIKQKNYSDLIRLMESLVEHFPSNYQYMGQLADAYISADQLKDAQKTIMQVKTLGAEAHQYVKQLEPIIEMARSEGRLSELNSAQVFDLKDALIIDSDVTVANAIRDSLTTMGVGSIENFMRGDEAWDRIKKGPFPDIIFTEWKIPHLNGAQIIQRIKTLKDCNTIIVVTSSLVKDENLMLVKEIGVSQIFEKPFEKQEFMNRLVNTLRQTKYPQEIRELEDQAYIAISQNNKDNLVKIKNTLQTKKNRPDDLMDLVSATLYYIESKYEEAKKHLLNILNFKSKISELQVQNLLGKVLLKLGLFAEAEQCFEKANKLSPNNIERLALLAETQLQIGAIDKTEGTISDAKEIDSKNSKVSEVESKLALTLGDTERLDATIQKLDSVQDFVAFTNNQAVSLVKINKIPKAIELYKTANSSKSPSLNIWKPFIDYNLSLAYAKNKDYQSAIKVLQNVEKSNDERIKKKSFSLLERLKVAIKEGKELEFYAGAVAPSQTVEESSIDIRIKLWGADIKAGEMGCFKIFSVSNEANHRFMLYLKNTPQVGAVNGLPLGEHEMPLNA